jgi:diguanylate cyclase (GGDEF)-like protein
MEIVVRQNQKPMKVLVVDDDPTTIALLERHPIDSGYIVRCSSDGADALRLIEEWRPNILVLNWIMPGMDGPEVCRQIRSATVEGTYTYVMMLTVHVEKQRVVEAFEAGVDDFLSKPLDRGELLARMHAAARRIELHEELFRRERRAQRLTARMEKMNHQLRQLAMTDELTGLMNRREANHRLNQAWALAERYHHSLSCALIDVDDFKTLNDTLGHAAGDMVLTAVGNRLKNILRTTDGICRYGGDEFLLFFPHQTADEAAFACERVRKAIAEIRSPANRGPLTTSIGIAQRGEGMLTFHDLIDQADRALYHAKRLGKNQIWSDAEALLPVRAPSELCAIASEGAD